MTSIIAGPFPSLDAGYRHACALGSTGAVTCWGQSNEGQATAPSGTFAQIATGDQHSCALDAGGRATCWGSNPSFLPAPVACCA
jgi:alpha-tubulin suppressor-like RCC1 family protein